MESVANCGGERALLPSLRMVVEPDGAGTARDLLRRDCGAKLRGCDSLCASSVAVGGTENDTAALGGSAGWMQRITSEANKAGTWRGHGHGEQHNEWSACRGSWRCDRGAVVGPENIRGRGGANGWRIASGGGTRPGGTLPSGDFTDGRGEGADSGSCNSIGAED